MKYKNIASTLGWDECPSTEEGLFLQPEEATAVDNAIANAAVNEQLGTGLSAANATVGSLTSQLADAHVSLATANARITELEAENERLGSESSGKGSTVVTTEDTSVTTGETPSYLADNNPANEWIDKQLSRKKK